MRGFSLIELAIAMAIIALVTGGLLVPLTTQVAQRKTTETQKTLEEIREALVGYAIRHGRLPCPATNTSKGIESFVGAVGASACANAYSGFVPAATLGLSAIDARGYAIDGWGTPLRYAVTTANTNAFTTVRGMQTAAIQNLTPNLYVCASGSGVTPTTCGAAQVLANGTPAVIYSAGPNWATGPNGADETANLANAPVFVSRVSSGAGANGGEFDDIVTWLPAPVLYSRMVSAGQLP